MENNNPTRLCANRSSSPDQKQGVHTTAVSADDPGVILRTLAEGANTSLVAALDWINHLSRQLEHQRLTDQPLEEQLESLSDQLNLPPVPVDTILSNLNNLRAEIPRLSETIRRVTERQEVTDNNVEQLRLLSESLDRKMDRLSADFIDRHVTDPLFKQFLGLFASLRSLASSDKATIHEEVCALAQQVECLLESHGLSLIQATEGEALDPRAHQPIQVCVTDDGALHGCIAQTFQAGLRSSERILQLARVAVFICKGTGPLESTTKGTEA